ncbi:MAG: DUF2723 domain-containing protein [Gemmatimonadota bacterium]|nr:DUF2723 domain-containing protein [Gemmatimonadota bacterium]
MWDAGEFIAAVHTFGIPHQPGTPLYVMLARAWSLAMPFAGTALATNLFSAACTAAAGGVLALVLWRVTRSWPKALGGALCAGGMFTVWSSATETEVYASVLLLVMLGLLTALAASEASAMKWRVATAYAFALAVPLHIGALVAAPAALMLVAHREDGSLDLPRALPLAAAMVFAAGIGVASTAVVAAGVVAILGVALVRTRARSETLAMSGCTLLAISALAVLVVRARFDPWLNEGAPATLRALWDVIGRRQYGVAGMWPRQAPLWVQVANWFEYADWQVALGVHDAVAPSWTRTPITTVFAVLGVVGSLAHWRMHRPSWRAFAVLFVSATVGLIVYLNFKAGASFGWGVLSESVPHEVRDRDYFFVLGFWVWGAWAGIGAVAVAERVRAEWAPIGALAAALPLVLNARAADRRAEPERSIARLTAFALLESVPPNAVLVTGGDNDSFPAWYAQSVEGVRPDVTIVVAPLLGTEWYRAQLARRASLVTQGEIAHTRAASTMIAAVAREARARGRPIAVSIMTPEATREAAGDLTVARGIVYVEREGSADPKNDSGHSTVVHLGAGVPDVDTAFTAAFVRSHAVPLAAIAGAGIDPAPESFVAYLACPAQYLAIARGGIALSSLDSVCKLQ